MASTEPMADDRIATRFERFDDRFRRCTGDEWVRRIYTGGRWTEGPAYFPGGRYLLFSDIPNDRVLRWDELTDVVGVFREPANFANGHLMDRHGRLVSCEQGTRRLTRTDARGVVSVIADNWEGRRFNSPDVVVEHSDGGLWFSDPSYGIDTDYEGIQGRRELDRCMVFRLDPDDDTVTMVLDELDLPNGLAFTTDEQGLFVADCATNTIHRYRVDGHRGLAAGSEFARVETGAIDSLAVDDADRLWAAAGTGVDCYDPDGTLLGRLELPETVSNLTFGGPRGNDLFITATSSVYTLRLRTGRRHDPRVGSASAGG